MTYMNEKNNNTNFASFNDYNLETEADLAEHYGKNE